MVNPAKIVLQHAQVNDRNVIQLQFDLENKALAQKANTLHDRKWDKQGAFLYVPNTRYHLKHIFKTYKGVAWVDSEHFFKAKFMQEACGFQRH